MQKRRFKYDFGRKVEVAKPYWSDPGDWDHYHMLDCLEFILRSLNDREREIFAKRDE
jgi:hypothetical protein